MESSPGRAPRLDRTPAGTPPGAPSLSAPGSPPVAAPGLPPRIWLLLGVLATMQFLNTVDFMIMMPLSPQFMRLFAITISQFSAAVSAYAVAAGVAGVGAALMLDRYGRRGSILFIFGGLVVGTFFCALAPSYGALLAARIFCGLFGGILGASVLAAVGDLVPDSHRGRAVGIVMSSFSLATVLGLPLGLWLADRWGWHAPFLTLAGAGTLLWVLAAQWLPPMRAHLTAGNARIRPLDRLRGALRPAAHRRAYALMGALTLAGMCVVPYIAAYLVGNVGLEERRLTLVYAVGGAGTLVSMNVVGRLADAFDRFRVFAGVCVASMLVTLALTHAPPLGLGAALVLSAAMMVFMSGRFIPAMAMATTAGDPTQRGAYMGVMASIQQFASGLAALGSGWLVTSDAAGHLAGYGNGWLDLGDPRPDEHPAGVAAAGTVSDCLRTARWRGSPREVAAAPGCGARPHRARAQIADASRCNEPFVARRRAPARGAERSCPSPSATKFTIGSKPSSSIAGSRIQPWSFLQRRSPRPVCPVASGSNQGQALASPRSRRGEIAVAAGGAGMSGGAMKTNSSTKRCVALSSLGRRGGGASSAVSRPQSSTASNMAELDSCVTCSCTSGHRRRKAKKEPGK